MTIAKFAVPVLSTLALFASAVAVADGTTTDASTDASVTLCVIGSDDALGTSCTISVDGDVLTGAYLVPGPNYITVVDPGMDLVVAGEEVLAKWYNPGSN